MLQVEVGTLGVMSGVLFHLRARLLGHDWLREAVAEFQVVDLPAELLLSTILLSP